MRQQGRQLRFRHLFPELFVPGVQFRRAALRLQWFLLHRLDFRPVWTVGALAGLGGVLLTVSLFLLPTLPKLAIAARLDPPQRPSLPIPPVFPPLPYDIPPQPAPVSLPAPIVLPSFQDNLAAFGLLARWDRLTMGGYWDDRRQSTVVSDPLPMEQLIGDSAAARAAVERWTRWIARALPTSMQNFSPYREPVGLRNWEPISPVLSTTDLAVRGSGVGPQSQPVATIEKRTPQASTPGGPLRYELIVTNPSLQPLPEVTVYEAVDVRRVTAVDPPARIERDGLVWKLGGLAPGERRLLTVSVWTEGLAGDVSSLTEIELADRVAASMQVERPIEEPYFRRDPTPAPPPLPTPQPAPQPAPPPIVDLPPFPVQSDLPPFPKFDELPPFTRQNEPPPVVTPPTPAAPPPAIAPAPRFETLPPFPTFPATVPTPPPAMTPPPAGRPLLKLRAEPPKALTVGRDATTWYEIENVGTAPATDIVLLLTLPDGLQHHDGSQVVRYAIRQLHPREKRRAQLITRVRRGGVFQVAGELTAGEQKETSLVQLVAPEESAPAPRRPNDAARDSRSDPCQCRPAPVKLARN